MAFNHLPSSDSEELFGNCALVQSYIPPKWLFCVYIHLACQKIKELYRGLPEDDVLCFETHWSNSSISVTKLIKLCIQVGLKNSLYLNLKFDSMGDFVALMYFPNSLFNNVVASSASG